MLRDYDQRPPSGFPAVKVLMTIYYGPPPGRASVKQAVVWSVDRVNS